MEDPTSLFTIEDDGSLVILKSTSANCDTFDSASAESLLAASMESLGSRTITENDNAVSVPAPTTIPLASHSKTDEAESCEVATGENEDDDLGILSLSEINQILRKEQENLQLIRMANEMMKSLVMKQNSLSTQMKDASVDTTTLGAPAPSPFDDSVVRKEDLDENEDLSTPSGPVRPYQRLFRRLSNNFRRRRQPVIRPNRTIASSPSNVNVQAFVQDYYRSLGSVSRYIISASILSFITAFLLLSFYSAQTHSHDMELFHLKEQRVLANQEVYEKLQLNHENFRESLIHMRYEESRECHSSLKECQAKRDDLLTQIAQIEQSSGKGQTRLEAKLDTQRKFIETLQSKLRELSEENKELRKEIGQSFSSSYAQILLSFLNIARNRSIQIAFGTVFTIAMLFVIAGTALTK